jgi:hypothetical protein
MNFFRALPCLCLGLALQAQSLDLRVAGGGELTIAETTYRFEPGSLFTAPPKGGLPGAIRIQGRLVPTRGAGAFDLDLTVLKTGTLYQLRLERKGPGAYPDSWAATAKTRLRPLSLQDRPGGRVELECLGPLTGVIARKPRTASWSGRIWATFPGEAAPAPGPTPGPAGDAPGPQGR